jgi:hypothetical protein
MARFTPSAGPPAAFHHVRADDHFISRMSSMKVVILLINKSSYVGAVLEELEIVCFEVEEGLCCETRPTRPTSIFGSWSWIGEDCIMHDNNKQCNRLFLLGKMLDWILEKMGILKGAVGWRGCKWHPQRILCSLDLSRCSFLDKVGFLVYSQPEVPLHQRLGQAVSVGRRWLSNFGNWASLGL